MKYKDFYQFTLIFFAFVVAFGVGYFIYKELFPEYKSYQYAYIDIERMRAASIGDKPPPFETGIKQIVIPDNKQGPEVIDRCTSCHVAMDLPHFSPVRVKIDVNDNPVIGADGKPLLEPNPDYVWSQFPEVPQTGALQAHPLIGAETRPFEYHPMEEYGCTSCHSGNGRALVAKRAHGPVYDEDYEPAYENHKPQFTEVDPENDPAFARMYNNKPGHDLVFQTTPLLAGELIVAKCVQCHQSASDEVKGAIDKIGYLADEKTQKIKQLEAGIANDRAAVKSLEALSASLEMRGLEGTVEWLNKELGNYRLTSRQIDAYEGQLRYVEAHENLEEAIAADLARTEAGIAPKLVALETAQEELKRLQSSTEPLTHVSGVSSQVDSLISSYHDGKELFVSQACYACHRIAGFSRSSVGPELTFAGLKYPWYVKESIVWPQADLPSSTMPNFHLDHEELEDLMTFLMAQTGDTKAVSEVDYEISLQQWEAGAKMPWEKPVTAEQIKNVREGMHVYATEGCAACHKLEGFTSNVDVTDREWFAKMIPEQIMGSMLATVVLEKGEEIDKHVVQSGRTDGMLEELDQELVEGFYTNFKFAGRVDDSAAYQERLQRVLMAYIQLYGLGRDIAPHLSYSGVYRDDAWLLGHFHNPSAYTAKSIMPVMPFDNSKFYMLNHMLHALGFQNRDQLQQMWKEDGFEPALAYELLCSSCHGVHRQGNGIISEWIYPIPKNLRNPVFLRNLTKAHAIESITEGVNGTPMPPWGESVIEGDPVLTEEQIVQLVDWLYQGLPEDKRSTMREDFAKWDYEPEDVVEEMVAERRLLKPVPDPIDAEEYFDEDENIRERYYTEENLAAGKEFYEVNCATCHGNDGGGMGLRATSMVEAKPRMFTNLPWIRGEEDVDLLLNIKYGIPGTAMIAWGDQTTAELRMQLVMYIRSLTSQQVLSEELYEVLYEVFGRRICQAYEADDRSLIPPLQRQRKIYKGIGEQMIAAELPRSFVYDFFEIIRGEGDEEALIRALDEKIAVYQKQIDIEEQKIRAPERGKTIQELMDKQGVLINLRTKLVVGLADAKEIANGSV